MKATVGQIKQKAEIDINFLGRLVAPEVMVYDFPPLYIAAFQIIVQGEIDKEEFARLLLGLPRGHGKSFFAKLVLLWVVLFTDRRFIFIVTASGDLAEDILADLWDFITCSNVIEIWGNAEVSKDNAEKKEIKFCGRDIIIQAKGAGAKVRGKSRHSIRPDFYFLDDVQTLDNARSPTLSHYLYEWILGTLLKGRSPISCQVIYCGNKYPYDGSIVTKFDKHPDWRSFVVGAILSNGQALWEQVRSKASLLKEFKSDMLAGLAEMFCAEMLNSDEVGLHSGVDVSNILDSPEDYVSVGKALILDLATDKDTKDQIAFVHFDLAMLEEGVKPVIREVNVSKENHIKVASQAISLCLASNIPLICYEDEGFQHIMKAEIERQLSEHDIWGIQVRPVTTKKVNKTYRIKQYLFKPLTSGEILVHPKARSLVVDQINCFNVLSAHNIDDILDCSSYIPKVVELYQSEMMLAIGLDEDAYSDVIEDNF